MTSIISTAWAQEEEAPKLQVSGAVDAYYKYDFGKSPNAYTSFTDSHNSFQLGMANLILSQQVGKVGFVADLAVGPRADAANGYVSEDGSISSLSLIKQLYMTYSPTDYLTVTAGNFSTFVGYEVIDANGNFNYSTSYLFSNGPFYHTGVKLDFDLGNGVSAMAGIFNQTDTKFQTIDPKFYGLQLGYAPEDSGLALYLNYLYGNQSGDEDVDDIVSQIDLTGTYQATDAFMIGLNSSYKSNTIEGMEGNYGFFGTALYLNYAITESFGLGARGEHFEMYGGEDETGSALSENVMEFTLSANIKQGPLTIIPEFRFDKASVDMFSDADDNPTDAATSFLVAAYYSF
ncbi:porin [Limibacter armeniacum]|uniref:porin n=1 Tax=Limibacter armeniacum TaxID=466084 RepID=UPI002FE5F012